tara:strand:+ start:13388 stop:14491 length:1104 start_codon:yes stop_codon:yes gene_type:complete
MPPMKIYLIPLFILSIVANCNKAIPKTYNFDNENFQFSGRYEFQENNAALISPGASIAINFSGNLCKVNLKAEKLPYNYVSFELDGEYLGRIKIESDTIKEYVINVATKEKEHSLKIIKETEASNGAILFSGITVEKVVSNQQPTIHYIEFIGDSVTCGAAADGSTTPCNIGEYFDQENVYFSYGATTARALNTDFTLSSVSGIGMYRNWNDEHIEEPIMPEVYENLYLNTNTSVQNNFEHVPDIVSICLGTNDLSNGDGKKSRLPFNREKYIANYIGFIKKVYTYYPETQLVLLNSPMIQGETNTLLVSCLKEIQSNFPANTNKPILVYEFDKAYNKGCSWHPSVNEHKEIAQKLTPFFKEILNKS